MILRRLSGDNLGSLSIELALIGMALFFTLLVIFDFMRVINGYMAISASLRSGMQYAIFRPVDADGIIAAVKSTSPELDADRLEVKDSVSCECNSLPLACSGEVCPGTMRTYMTISAHYRQPLMVIYPVIGKSLNIERTISFRVY